MDNLIISCSINFILQATENVFLLNMYLIKNLYLLVIYPHRFRHIHPINECKEFAIV